MNESEFRKAYVARQNHVTADKALKEKTYADAIATAPRNQEARRAPEVLEKPVQSVRRGSTKKWWVAAAACFLAMTLVFGIPIMMPGGEAGSDSTNTLGFAVQAYAADNNTLLAVGQDEKILFSRSRISAEPYSDYEKIGVYTGCIFTVQGEGITRVQASIDAGELYRYTYEEFRVGDESEKFQEASRWKPARRGLGQYYGGYDDVELVLAGNGVDWGRKEVDANQVAQIRLTKRYGSVIDVPVDVASQATTCFGLWTNEPYGEDAATDYSAPYAEANAVINTFEGKKLTVTVQFEDGHTATQIIELHAADFRAEEVPDAIGSGGPGLRLIPEIVDPGTLGPDERFARSLYGSVIESNDGAFPGLLENANAREGIVDDWEGLSRRALYTSAGDRTIAPADTYEAAAAIPLTIEIKEGSEAALEAKIAGIERSHSLPEGIAPADLVPGMFGDTEYANRCSEQVFGYQVSNEGVITDGFSFVVIDIDFTNTGLSFDLAGGCGTGASRYGIFGGFVVGNDEAGHYSSVLSGYSYSDGLAEIMTSREVDMIAFAAGETKRMRYVLPVADEALDNADIMLQFFDMEFPESGPDIDHVPYPERTKAFKLGDLI